MNHKNTTNNQPFINNFTLDVIFTNLDNISKINIGDKLIHDNKYITIDSSYAQSLTRWIYGFSRFSILEFINELLNEAYAQLKILKENTDDTSGVLWIKLIFRLKNSASGLIKLRQTYGTDEEFIKQIDIIIKKLLKHT
jgi:hypothetical protein